MHLKPNKSQRCRPKYFTLGQVWPFQSCITFYCQSPSFLTSNNSMGQTGSWDEYADCNHTQLNRGKNQIQNFPVFLFVAGHCIKLNVTWFLFITQIWKVDGIDSENTSVGILRQSLIEGFFFQKEIWTKFHSHCKSYCCEACWQFWCTLSFTPTVWGSRSVNTFSAFSAVI